ncbi:MAG: hypothetical protein RRB13_03305 [bacterium]|nr:hypothetical protein [bacterium]
MALYNQLTNSIRLGQAKQDELSRAVERGAKFFKEFNDSRMQLAFSNFDEPMKKALYEILFFLHVNDPKFAQHKYTCVEIQKVDGRLKEVEVEKSAELYVEGCPAGVLGIHDLSPRFKEDFEAYITAEFGHDLPHIEGFLPIYSVASLGSIGTVGHKKGKSDLDLQVQYELAPFLFKQEELSDPKLFGYAKELIHYFGRVHGAKKKYKREDLKKPEVRSELMAAGKAHFKKRYPILFNTLVARTGSGKIAGSQKVELIHEIIGVASQYQKFCQKKERLDLDAVLKNRIHRIQTYIQEKFPDAEVYLFAYSNDDYRDGKHGTTLESKEASGSAYELILNYETLMPGIQFTPMIPIHFLMPDEVNSNRKQYEKLVNYLRFHFISIYDPFKRHLVDLGSTPPLTLDYMVAHSGAIYWESFKASSGNLPKALLNLLRLEMLFDSRFNISIMELIKEPERLDRYVLAPDAEEVPAEEDAAEEEEADFFADYGILRTESHQDEGAIYSEEDFKGGLRSEELFKLEQRFQRLQEDPWWMRYKALKIGFAAAEERIPDQAERDLISEIIDLGFALHVRVSDVFGPPKKNLEMTYREQVLRQFLDKAFPMTQRVRLEHIFMGEVQAVDLFEEDLKRLFKNSMARVLKIVDESPGGDQTNRDEFRIWYHYYQKHFEPARNVVRPDILSHLKVARDRLQIGFDQDKRQWFFQSVQKKDAGQGNFSAEALEHLPEKVTLYRHRNFLHGIAHCMMNGYYGVFNKGTLFQRTTQLELVATNMNLGKRTANTFCYITPDLVERMVERVDRNFPPQEYDYRDCIYKEREITEVFICLNLLEFGSLTVMYRDNMKVWYVDQFDHPELEKAADDYYQAYDVLLGHAALFKTLRMFFKAQKFPLSAANQQKLTFWVNPHSARTGHPGNKPKQKEDDLAAMFKKAFFDQLKQSAETKEKAS